MMKKAGKGRGDPNSDAAARLADYKGESHVPLTGKYSQAYQSTQSTDLEKC